MNLHFFCSYIKKLTHSKGPLFERMLSYIGGSFLILNFGLLSVTGRMYLLSRTFFVNMMSIFYIFPVLGSYNNTRGGKGKNDGYIEIHQPALKRIFNEEHIRNQDPGKKDKKSNTGWVRILVPKQKKGNNIRLQDSPSKRSNGGGIIRILTTEYVPA